MAGVKFNLAKGADTSLSFVKQVPLPVPSQVGVKIQARNGLIYNPGDPTRDQIRKSNFHRRYRQLTEEGFVSPIWKPYQGIGDPFYLDDRTLLIKSLGLPEKPEKEHSDPSDVRSRRKSAQSSRQVTSAKNSSRRFQKRVFKGGETLRDAMKKSEDTGKYVRIGHSYFDIIEKEKQQRAFKERHAKELAHFRARTEIRPPKVGSSSSEDDHEGDPTRRTFSGWTEEEARERRRKKFIPRPYTPVHCNICIPLPKKTPENPQMLRSVYRQLCSLHWFLEAMTQETQNVMKPISNSWNVNQGIGGVKTTSRYRENQKKANQSWDRFVSGRKLKLKPRESGYSGSGRLSTVGHVPVATPLTPGSTDQAAGDSTGRYSTDEGDMLTDVDSSPESRGTSPTRSSIRPKSSRSQKENKSNPDCSARGVPRLVKSASTNRQKKTEILSMVKSTIVASRKKLRIPLPLDLEINMLSRATITQLARCIALELDDGKGLYQERKEFRQKMMSKDDVNDDFVLDPECFSSTRLQDFVTEMRYKYDTVTEDRMSDLQDKLEHMARSREKVCREKFLALPERMAPHRAIKEMRSRSRYDRNIVDPSAEARSLVFAHWYHTLLDNLSPEVTNTHYVSLIVGKLKTFALMQSNKATVNKFIRVLNTLTEWEICHPDVVAAIVFIRLRVVEMPDEDFDQWFTDKFPSVALPSLTNAIRLDCSAAALNSEITPDKSDPEKEVIKTETPPPERRNVKVRPMTK